MSIFRLFAKTLTLKKLMGGVCARRTKVGRQINYYSITCGNEGLVMLVG